MCILFIYTEPNPRPGTYRLILASNRDEYYARPAQTAELCTKTKVISGKDLEPSREGGMWLGLSINEIANARCRIGTLLNIPGETYNEHAKYRGMIVRDYLTGTSNADFYIDQMKKAGEHRPHNFVAIEVGKDNIITYHNCSVQENGLNIFSGKNVLGFGNCTVQTPLLKVKNGTARFEKLITEYNNTNKAEELIKELTTLLKWDQKHLPDEELKRRNPMGFENLSSVFVNIDNVGYGSRAHTIILIDYDWNITFVEESIKDKSAKEWDNKVIKAQL